MPADADRLTSIRHELPVTARLAYLNTGINGPLPRRALAALTAEAERELAEGRSDFKWFDEVYFPLRDRLRARFARLLGAETAEIALTSGTSEGMNDDDLDRLCAALDELRAGTGPAR